MAVTDVENRILSDFRAEDTSVSRAVGPRPDLLGRGLCLFHCAVGFYICLGWMLPSANSLLFYMTLLPMIAMQWMVNQGSCVINNFETLLRTGHWRDPSNVEEAGFVQMLARWWIGKDLSRAQADMASYVTVLVLWTLGLAHFLLLAA